MWAVIDKIANFQDIAPNFTYSQISQFFKYICNFLDQLLHPLEYSLCLHMFKIFMIFTVF